MSVHRASHATKYSTQKAPHLAVDGVDSGATCGAARRERILRFEAVFRSQAGKGA